MEQKFMLNKDQKELIAHVKLNIMRAVLRMDPNELFDLIKEAFDWEVDK